MSEAQAFAEILLDWDRRSNHRPMPWKGLKDPYRIWLSEIILQQTRVEQGEKYYLSLTDRYPSVHHLAEADDREVYTVWQGLGYYNRCRNMLSTARFVSRELGGHFPEHFEGLKGLKGIGEYTAAAIASFAYGAPHAVTDGNVVRVLSRIFGIRENFQGSAGQKLYREMAQRLLPSGQSAAFNQAMMDFGATVCTPRQPLCSACPFAHRCEALRLDAVGEFPPPKIKKPLKDRHFHFWLPLRGESVFLLRRNERDIWHHLYTPPFLESIPSTDKPLQAGLELQAPVFTATQVLSHQKVTGHFYRIPAKTLQTLLPPDAIRVQKSGLNQYPFPRLILSFFQKFDYL